MNARLRSTVESTTPANERMAGMYERKSGADAPFRGAALRATEGLLEPPHRVAAAADVDGVRRLEAEVGTEFHHHLVSPLDRDHGAAGALADAEARGMAAGEAVGRDLQDLELRIDGDRLL